MFQNPDKLPKIQSYNLHTPFLETTATYVNANTEPQKNIHKPVC